MLSPIRKNAEDLHRLVVTYVGAITVTVTGNWAQNVVLAVLALDVSGSPFVAGIAVSLRQLPLLLAGRWIGPFLDRHNKAVILVVTQGAAGLLSLGFFALMMIDPAPSANVVLIYALGAGLLNATDVPSRMALIGELVPSERVSATTAAANIGSAAGRAIGPAVAAAVIAIWSLPWVFALNGVTFAISAYAFWTLRRAVPDAADLAGRSGDESTQRARIAELGLGPVLALTIAVALLVLNSQVLILALLEGELDGSDDLYGVALAAIGVGAVGGALGAGRISTPSFRLLAATAGVLAAVMALSATLTAAWMVVPVVLIAGAAGGFFATASSTYLQRAAPDESRGTVMSMYAMAFAGAAPLGAPLAGGAADVLGPREAYLAFAAVLTVSILAAWIYDRAASAPSNG